MIRVASFDIGKKNFAFVVEEFTKEDLKNINKKVIYKWFKKVNNKILQDI